MSDNLLDKPFEQAYLTPRCPLLLSSGAPLLNSLFVTRGNNCGKSYVLTDQTITIGRDQENSILLQDEEVSRLHCSIFIESSRIYLVDEGSSNGTFLNGSPIKRAEVTKGDKIRIGKTQFEFNSFLQISMDQEDASPLTAWPTRVNKSSLEPTKFIAQAETETDSNSPKLVPDKDNDDDHGSLHDQVPNSKNQHAGQPFVQIKNDLKFVYQASLATSRTLDIHAMFHELIELIFEWIPADRGCVYLLNQQTGALEAKYVKKRHVSGSLPGQNPKAKIEVDKTIIEYVAEHKVAVLSQGLEPNEEKQIDPRQTRPLVDEVMCVPLEGHGKLLGVLYIDTLSRSSAKPNLWFNRDNLRMILALAQQAVVAIENASFLETQLEKERDLAFGQVTNYMEHRINNILQGINGGSHLMEAGLKSENLDLCKKGWEITNNNQTKIAELVGDLMVLSSSLSLKSQPCDMAKLVVETAQSMKSAIKDAKLACQLPTNIKAIVSADRDAIKTCLNYLFRMVIDSAVELGGTLEFSISQDQESLNLTVRHPGQPIQTCPTSGSDQGSCCIASAVIHKIVRAHQGKITVGTYRPSQLKGPDSQFQNQKSEAMISLPLNN